MKKPLLYLLIVLFACFYTPCGAQNFQIRWQQSIGGSSQDIATCFVQTPDGGTLLAGNSNSTNADVTGNIGSTDIFIVKQNPAGVILWKKNLGGANLDEVQSIKNTIDHGFILVGFTMSNDSDVTGNHGGYDAWVIKLDSIGTRVWQKCLGGSAWDFGRSVQPTRDGGYIIAGETGSIDGDVTGSHGNNDFWVVKLNSAGALLWQKTLGGSLNEEAYSIIETNDHGYFVAGNSESSDGDITGTNGGYDFWVAKLDSTGHLQWQKTVGGTHDEYAHEAIQTSDGGYLIAGETNSNDGDVSGNHGQRDEWLVKLDSTGLLLWQKTFGSSLNDIAMSLTKTADGNLLMAGSSAGRDADVHGNHANEDFWVKKITENGRILWQKCLGGSGVDIAHMIQPTIDGHVIVAGQSTSQNGDLSLNRGNEDFWIVKLSIPRHSITGHVFTDFNLDCTFNTGEKEITHTLLYNQNENTYATVEDSGYTIYTFEADTASITVINLDSMLAISCIMADTLPIYFSPSSSFDTTQINFPISAMISCAKPEILDFSNSIPRRCTWIDQTISYRNSGFD